MNYERMRATDFFQQGLNRLERARAKYVAALLCSEEDPLSCHRGLNSSAGAEGVGRAATQAFVTSFVVILVLDFLLSLFFNQLGTILWGAEPPRFTPRV